MKHLLIVCTGGICRSPMAMGLLRQGFHAAGLGDQVTVSAAGTFAQDGQPASRHGVDLLAERGVEIGAYRSHTVTRQDLAQADLILAMTEDHRRSLFHKSPQHLAKVLLLSELCGDHQDVDDPYGGDRAAYAQALAQIQALIDAGWPTLLRRLGLSASRS